jgi:hypothetical protein
MRRILTPHDALLNAEIACEEGLKSTAGEGRHPQSAKVEMVSEEPPGGAKERFDPCRHLMRFR